MSLKPKQEAFCQEYLVDLNATQAAIRAGYSAKTAQEQSSRLLSNVMVAARINELKQARSERTQITADVILGELLKLATVDISKAFDAMGGLLPLNEMPEDVRRAISAIEVNEIFSGQGDDKHVMGLNRKIRFWDKPKSLELLGKHLALFTDKQVVTGKDGGPIQLESLPMKALQDELKELADLREKQGNDSGTA